MGNDLLIATLAIETGKEPNWEAARERVREMSDEEFVDALEPWRGDYELDDDGNLDREKAIEDLLDVVEHAQLATQSEHRHLYASEYVVPGWTVYITGGDSWGDPPSEEFDVFNCFLNAGFPGKTLAEVAGFAARFVEPSHA